MILFSIYRVQAKKEEEAKREKKKKKREREEKLKILTFFDDEEQEKADADESPRVKTKRDPTVSLDDCVFILIAILQVSSHFLADKAQEQIEAKLRDEIKAEWDAKQAETKEEVSMD